MVRRTLMPRHVSENIAKEPYSDNLRVSVSNHNFGITFQALMRTPQRLGPLEHAGSAPRYPGHQLLHAEHHADAQPGRPDVSSKHAPGWLRTHGVERPRPIPSPARIFHLVVDELHTYRGTAGTEVAYLIRLLLHRLGISPDSPQVRFLASSASLTNDEASQEISQGVFWGERRATTSRGICAHLRSHWWPTARQPLHNDPIRYAGQAEAFAMFRDDWNNNPAQSVQALAQRLEHRRSTSRVPPVSPWRGP